MRTKKDKRIRVLEVQRKRAQDRLLKLKKYHEPINKILSQVKQVDKKVVDKNKNKKSK